MFEEIYETHVAGRDLETLVTWRDLLCQVQHSGSQGSTMKAISLCWSVQLSAAWPTRDNVQKAQKPNTYKCISFWGTYKLVTLQKSLQGLGTTSELWFHW